MNKRLIAFFAAALLPVVLLAVFFGDDVASRLGEPSDKEKYQRSPGADIVAYVENSCPHCADFHAFADAQGWAVDFREVSKNDSIRGFSELQAMAPTLNQGVPTIVLDGHIFQGYGTDEDSGANLKKIYDDCRASSEGCLSYDDFIASNPSDIPVVKSDACVENCEADDSEFIVDLWFFGEVNLLDWSLPALSLTLGFIDGFNPCAMWVLITLLTLLINTHDLKKVWIVGGTFLFVSGAIYFVFIAAWLETFRLIGINAWLQLIIGIVAIGGGTFYLYEALSEDPDECKVTNMTQRQKTIAKMKEVMSIAQWPAMIIGVSILAISVNTIELVCTAGLPAVFTQVLHISNISKLMQYWYMFLFIIMYMIDDMVVFAIAVKTLHASGLTTKYRRITLITGGVLMYALGILMIYFPNALIFGG